MDDYEGYGSLTEMAQNKNALVEKQMNSPPQDDAIVQAK